MIARFAAPKQDGGARHAVRRWERLSLALALSALLHVWLAGTAVTMPERRSDVGVPALTVELERRAAPRDADLRPEPESATASESAAAGSKGDGRAPVGEVARRPASGANDSRPATDAARTAAITVVPAEAGDSAYYSARELDVFPIPREPLKFPYPRRAARDQIGGKVTVTLLVDETGAVNQVVVDRAEPAGYFEESIRAVLGAARFSPARRNGRVVKSRIRIDVDYDPGAAEDALR